MFAESEKSSSTLARLACTWQELRGQEGIAQVYRQYKRSHRAYSSSRRQTDLAGFSSPSSAHRCFAHHYSDQRHVRGGSGTKPETLFFLQNVGSPLSPLPLSRILTSIYMPTVREYFLCSPDPLQFNSALKISAGHEHVLRHLPQRCLQVSVLSWHARKLECHLIVVAAGNYVRVGNRPHHSLSGLRAR